MTTDQPRDEPFRCPRCTESFAPHWRAGDGSALCRTCANERDGRCQFDTHPNHPEHPCSFGQEKPGELCRYCATPFPADGTPCAACWLSFDGMALADVRAVFAADGTFNTKPNLERP